MAALESYVSMRSERSPLSHFSKFPVVWNGYEFPTSEHACRAAMFMWGHPDVVFKILRARTPSRAIGLAQDFALSRRADWDDVRVQLTHDICASKLIQHDRVRRELLATGDRLIVLDVNNEFWGIGRNGTGQNEAGKIWMRLRDVVRGG